MDIGFGLGNQVKIHINLQNKNIKRPYFWKLDTVKSPKFGSVPKFGFFTNII